MDLGSRIKELRIRNSYTQEELAQKLSVTPQAISRWECGVSLPDISMIPLLTKTLVVSADELLGCGISDISESVSYKNRDSRGEDLNQSQIDSIFESIDIVSDGKSKNVLIVDDSDFIRMILKNILTKAGHTVVEVDNGKLALNVLEQQKINICILDIVMPEMNGIDTLRQILLNVPDMPVVMLSALCNKDIVMEAFEIGAKAFVAKPFQVESFIRRI